MLALGKWEMEKHQLPLKLFPSGMIFTEIKSWEHKYSPLQGIKM